MKLSPYLHFSGNCEEAFHFYEKALNGKIDSITRYADSPMADHVGPDFANKIINVTLQFGNQHIHGCDAPPDHQAKMQGITLCAETPNASESEKLFQAIAEGGSISMPFQKTFWSDGFGMATDKYGVPWMVNTSTNSTQPQA